MRRRGFVSAAVTGATVGAVAAPAVLKAQETFKWRMANLYPRGISFGVAYDAFAKRVEAMSGGRLVIESIYDGEGVAATEVFSACQSGLIEMGAPYMALHAGELPAGLVELGLPGGPSRYDQIYTLFDRGGWNEIVREAYASKGLHWVGPYMQPGVYLLTKQPITKLADLNGMKLRAPGAYGTHMKAFGVAPVTMAFSEVYTSLATGVIDGCASSNLIDYRDGKWTEQAKYLYPVAVSGAQESPIIVNPEAWSSLPDDLKAIVEVAQVEHCFEQVGMSIMGVADAVAEMRKGGAEWSPEPSAEDRAAWQQAAQAVWTEFAAADPFSQRMIEAQKTYQAKIAA